MMRNILISSAAAICMLMPHSLGAYETPNPIPQDNKLEFQILRDGKPFGTHVIAFDKNGSEITADIKIDMEYTLGPLSLFEYSHSNKEVWKNNSPQSLQSITDDDGDVYNVSATWSSAELEIETQDARYDAPTSIFPTSYWNPAYLKADTLLNSQKGELEEIAITPLGTEKIAVMGEDINADRYKIDSVIPIEILHDTKTGQWVGLEFEARGSTISYKRLNPVR